MAGSLGLIWLSENLWIATNQMDSYLGDQLFIHELYPSPGHATSDALRGLTQPSKHTTMLDTLKSALDHFGVF